MFGTTLAARVARCWQLSLVPRPRNLSSCTFDTRVLGTRLWTKQHKGTCTTPKSLTLALAEVPMVSRPKHKETCCLGGSPFHELYCSAVVLPTRKSDAGSSAEPQYPSSASPPHPL